MTYALDVFFIMSGFVIAKVVTEKQESYGVFILRRFMRLFPAFFAMLLIAILLRPFFGAILSARWSPDLANLTSDSALWSSETHYSWAHILAHLTMFHGAIPETLLPYSAIAFLPTVWFVSVQWQFYLIAPLLIFIGRRFGSLGWSVLVGGSMLLFLSFTPIMETLFPSRSFLLQRLPLLLAGVMCYWIFVEVGGKHKNLSWHLFLVSPILYLFSTPLAIWTAVFALMISDREAGGIARIKAFLSWSWFRRLGELSYSTYLVHFCLIWLIKAFILRFAPDVSRIGMLIGLFVFVIPLTVLASEALYRSIEWPGMQVGKYLTRSKSDLLRVLQPVV